MNQTCIMDPLALIAVQNATRSPSQHNAFDHMIQTLNPNDPNGDIRRCLDILKGNNSSLLHPCNILYSCICKETALDDDIELVAAMAAVILTSRFHGDFIVRQHLNWNCHAKKLHQEGVFKRMYRMSPSSFVRLLTMILPWLEVNKKQ